jgi:hypothetical protein
VRIELQSSPSFKVTLKFNVPVSNNNYQQTLMTIRRNYILILFFNIECPSAIRGHAVAQLVEALRYNSEGRGYDS